MKLLIFTGIDLPSPCQTHAIKGICKMNGTHFLSVKVPAPGYKIPAIAIVRIFI
jgi:hypothetical protein